MRERSNAARSSGGIGRGSRGFAIGVVVGIFGADILARNHALFGSARVVFVTIAPGEVSTQAR
jgi:hypothetical protein